jgi:hypothetical protein
VRPRKGSKAICSRCHPPAPGYDQLLERRFEFIPLWGFFVFLWYAMRRVDCRRCHAVVIEEVPRVPDQKQRGFRTLAIRECGNNATADNKQLCKLASGLSH